MLGSQLALGGGVPSKKDTRVFMHGQRAAPPPLIVPVSQQQRMMMQPSPKSRLSRSSRNTPEVQLFKNKHAYDNHMKVRDSIKKQSILEKADEYDPIDELHKTLERNRGRHASRSATDLLQSNDIYRGREEAAAKRGVSLSVSRSASPSAFQRPHDEQYLNALGGFGNDTNSPSSPPSLVHSRSRGRSTSPSITLRNFNFQEKYESKINTIVNAFSTADPVVIAEANKRSASKGGARTASSDGRTGKQADPEDGSSPDGAVKKTFRKSLSNGIVSRRTMQPWALNGRIDTPKVKIAAELQRISYTQRPATATDTYWSRQSAEAPREKVSRVSAFGNLFQDAIASALETVNAVDDSFMSSIARASSTFNPRCTYSDGGETRGSFASNGMTQEYRRNTRSSASNVPLSPPSSFSVPFISPINKNNRNNILSFREDDEYYPNQPTSVPTTSVSAAVPSPREAVRRIVDLTYSDEFKATVKDRTGQTTLRNFYLDPLAVSAKIPTKTRKPPTPSTKSPLVRIDWTENTTGRPITRQICRRKFFQNTK